MTQKIAKSEIHFSISQEELSVLIKKTVNDLLINFTSELFDEEKNICQKEILRPKDVQILLGCSRSHLDMLKERDPNFPKMIRLGTRWTGYLKKEIYEYIDEIGKTLH